jgi:lysophospholipase L1-like esterase
MNCAQDSVAVLTAGASGQALGLRPMLTKPEVRALSQRIIAMNAHIAAEAAARGWAVADWNTALRIAVATGLIPSFPNLLAPSTTIFGSIFSLDGVHPNLAGYKIIANAFIDAINTRYGTTLRYP